MILPRLNNEHLENNLVNETAKIQEQESIRLTDMQADVTSTAESKMKHLFRMEDALSAPRLCESDILLLHSTNCFSARSSLHAHSPHTCTRENKLFSHIYMCMIPTNDIFSATIRDPLQAVSHTGSSCCYCCCDTDNSTMSSDLVA